MLYNNNYKLSYQVVRSVKEEDKEDTKNCTFFKSSSSSSRSKRIIQNGCIANRQCNNNNNIRRGYLHFGLVLLLLLILNQNNIYTISALSNNNKNNYNMKISRIYHQCSSSSSFQYAQWLGSRKRNAKLLCTSLYQSTKSQRHFSQRTFVDNNHPININFNQNNVVNTIHQTANAPNFSTHKDQNTFISNENKDTLQSMTDSNHFEMLFSLDLPEGKCVGLRLSKQHLNNNSNNNNKDDDIPSSLSAYQIESNDDHWIKRILHPAEVQFGIELPSENARLTFFIGRLAMRTALMLASGCSTNPGDSPSGDAVLQCNDIGIGYEDRKFGGFIKLPSVSKLDHSILKDTHGRPQVPKGYIGSISHKKTTGVALVSNTSEDISDSSTPKIGIGVDIEQSLPRSKNLANKILTSNELDNLGQLNEVTRDEEVLLRFRLVLKDLVVISTFLCLGV